MINFELSPRMQQLKQSSSSGKADGAACEPAALASPFCHLGGGGTELGVGGEEWARKGVGPNGGSTAGSNTLPLTRQPKIGAAQFTPGKVTAVSQGALLHGVSTFPRGREPMFSSEKSCGCLATTAPRGNPGGGAWHPGAQPTSAS